jgi:hypothetical protein
LGLQQIAVPWFWLLISLHAVLSCSSASIKPSLVSHQSSSPHTKSLGNSEHISFLQHLTMLILPTLVIMKFTTIILGELLATVMASPLEHSSIEANTLQKRVTLCPCFPSCGCPTYSDCICVPGVGKAPCYPNCGCPNDTEGVCVSPPE